MYTFRVRPKQTFENDPGVVAYTLRTDSLEAMQFMQEILDEADHIMLAVYDEEALEIYIEMKEAE